MDEAQKTAKLLAEFNQTEAGNTRWWQKSLPMEGRATFLPYKDSMPGSVFNQRELALPGILAGALNAFTAPERARTGSDLTFNPVEEAANMALNTFGGGIATGKLVPNATGLGGKDIASNLIDTSYRGSHTPPNAEVYGAPLHDLTKIMPKDVYSSKGISLYGSGDPVIDREWFAAAYKAKNNPDAEITIYRAVPKGVKSINNGDWVTTSQQYAKNHGENALNGEYEIIKSKVKANTLSSEGYPYEFGYHEPTRKELLQQQFNSLNK